MYEKIKISLFKVFGENNKIVVSELNDIIIVRVGNKKFSIKRIDGNLHQLDENGEWWTIDDGNGVTFHNNKEKFLQTTPIEAIIKRVAIAIFQQ